MSFNWGVFLIPPYEEDTERRASEDTQRDAWFTVTRVPFSDGILRAKHKPTDHGAQQPSVTAHNGAMLSGCFTLSKCKINRGGIQL